MRHLSWAAAVLAALTPIPAAGQASAPANPAPRTVATDGYRSAFADFRPFEESRTVDWAGANARVAATGGHGGAIAGDAEEADATDTSPSHAGHHR